MLSILMFTAALAANAPLSPSSKWSVEYDKDMCVLSRSYGDGRDRVTLALRPYPMGTRTEIALMTPAKSMQVIDGQAEVILAPAAHSTHGTYSRYHLDTLPGSLSTLILGSDALDGIATSSTISLHLGSKEQHVFAIPGIAAAMRALEVCQADLLRTWGIDPAEQTSVITTPGINGRILALFGPSTYPVSALKAGEQGLSIAVATIGTEGTATACLIVVKSGSKALDDTTCEVLMQHHAHFSPGLDKDGKPVPAHAVVPVRWILPH